MNMTTDEKRVAIITGAGGGIGRATAMEFAKRRYLLVLADWSQDALNETARCVSVEGGEPVTVAGDITDDGHRSALIETVASHFGRLDVLVNNAGIMSGGAPEAITPDVWQKTFDVNVSSMFFLTQAALPLLLESGGNIVNNSSVNGLLGVPNGVPYGASKSAVVGFTRSLALDLGPKGVRVNAVCPGAIDTAMPRKYISDNFAADQQEEGEALVTRRHMIPRLGKPEEVSVAIAFLASPEASFITGVALPVDGGWSAW